MRWDIYTTRTDMVRGTSYSSRLNWIEVGDINAATRQVGLILKGTGAIPPTTERLNDLAWLQGPGDYVFYRNMRGKHPLGIADPRRRLPMPTSMRAPCSTTSTGAKTVRGWPVVA